MRKFVFRINFLSYILVVAILLSQAILAVPVFAYPQIKKSDKKSKTKPLPKKNYIRSRDFDTRHISLNLRFNWEKEQAIGIEEFTFSPLKSNFTKLTLDAGLMKFNSIKLKNGSGLKFEYDEKKAKLLIHLNRAYQFGDQITVVIDYQTKGKSISSGTGFGGGGGLTFVKPSAEEPTKPWQIWSQGESEYNKYWFPSFDYPNDFRTTEMKVTVKKPLMAISNGKLINIKDNKNGTRTYYWRMDSPYTNYLTSIVVGKFTEIKSKYKDIPISTYLYDEWADRGAVSVSRLPAMVKFYSEKLKLKYPYPKYAQTIARGFRGGMENISATTMTENLILDSRTELDRNTDGLQAHELVHQWFGNYVTCRDWSEIWLNESFATYLEALWAKESRGYDEFLYADVRRNQMRYFEAWRRGNRRPIVTKHYANPDAVFDTYAYPRGAAVLRMLHKQLGDENFWRALNHYLVSNAHQPVSTEDFRIAVEESTGQSMDVFFDQWLYKMGHPVFEVESRYNSSERKLTLSVKQVQEKDPTSLFPQADFFETPVDIEIKTSKESRIKTIFIEAKKENVFTFELDGKPILIDFDNEGTIIKEVRFKKSVDDLIYQMTQDKDVIGRRWAMGELSKIAKNKETSDSEKSKILSSLRKAAVSDEFWRLRRDALQQIRDVVLPYQNGNIMFDSLTLEVLKKATKDKHSLVRSEAISFLGLTGNAEFYEIFQSALSDKSYSVIDNAATALASTGNSEAYFALRKLAQANSWKNRIRIAGLNGLAALGDKRALDIGFRFASDKKQPDRVKDAALRVVAAVGREDERAFPLIFAKFKKSLKDNDFSGIFDGLQSIADFGDSRGQEAFDMAKEKFKEQYNLLNFIKQIENQFKQNPDFK